MMHCVSSLCADKLLYKTANMLHSYITIRHLYNIHNVCLFSWIANTTEGLWFLAIFNFSNTCIMGFHVSTFVGEYFTPEDAILYMVKDSTTFIINQEEFYTHGTDGQLYIVIFFCFISRWHVARKCCLKGCVEWWSLQIRYINRTVAAELLHYTWYSYCHMPIHRY